MRFLRSAILAIGVMGLSVGMMACGGSQGADETTTPAAAPAGDDTAAPATDDGTGDAMGGDDAAAPATDDGTGDAAAGDDAAANPCAGGENPCGGDL